MLAFRTVTYCTENEETPGGAGMSAPEDRQMAAKAVQMARKGVESGAKTKAKRHPSHYLKPVAL